MCIFWTLFPLIFVKFSECWMIITPIFILLLSIVVYIEYIQIKEFEIKTNLLAQRIRVTATNKLGIQKEIINIPLCNGCFHLSPKYNECCATEYGFRYMIHIWNNYNDYSELDLEKINTENIVPKFYWHFKDVPFFHGAYELGKWFELLIGNNILSEVKFIYKNENFVKCFKSRNLLSFTFRNYMKYYTLIFTIIFTILFYVVVYSFKDQYDEKGQYIYGAKFYLLLLGWHAAYIIMTFFLIFFHYYRRRIDIFHTPRYLFIGITTFCKKSYKKKYLFELDSIEECGFKENTQILSITLSNGNHETIWKFNEKEEDLKLISDGLKDIL